MNFATKLAQTRVYTTTNQGGVDSQEVYNEAILQSLDAISPTGAGTNSVAAETTAVSGSTISGLVGVSFITDATFTGSIAGAAVAANTTVNITPEVGSTLSAIAYIITTGNITIIKLNRP
jgi:predicted phage tail protein